MVNTDTKSGKAAFAAALTAVVIGGAVLSGWRFALDDLRRIVPGFTVMNPVTAAAFVLAGISLALFLRFSQGGDRKSRALIATARLCAAAVIFIGLARLAAILCGWDRGVDQWLFASKLANGLEPRSHIAPTTALNFLLLGGALVLMDVQKRSVRRGVEFAALVVGTVSLLAVLGYAYGVEPLYHLGPFGAMAVHTAITFSILSAGFLLSHTDRGLLAVFAGDNLGGKLTRRFLPAAVLITTLIGWLARLGEDAGCPVAFCDAAETVGNVLVLTVLVCWASQRIFNSDNRRKKAEEATRESEESFSIAFEHAPIGVALVSPDGRWLKINRAFCDLIGYSEAELLARTFMDITPPGERAAGREAGRRVLAGEIRTCELRKHYVHQRGHFIAVSVNISLVRDGLGQPRYFITHTQDITEHERAETASRESKRFLRATLDALSSHIAILDEHGVIIEVNAAWDRFAGENGSRGHRCGAGDNYLEICDSDAANSSQDAAALACGIRAVMAGQSDEFQLEYPFHSPLERRWFLVRVTRFGGDGPVRVVVAHANITMRKQAELARNESQLRYRALFENMLEGYACCRLLYDEQGRAYDYVYVEVNNKFEPLTGLKDVVGKLATEVMPGVHENDPGLLELYSRVTATGQPEKFESYVVSVATWFSISVYSPEKEHFVAVFDNITERKRAEISLRFDEQRYRSLVEATTAMVWDMPASGQFEVEQPGWTALTGQSFKELRGWGWLRAIHPDDQAETGRVWSAAVESRSIFKVEHRLRARDGTYRHMMVRAVPVLAEDGAIRQWIGIHSDITEQKRAEAELRWKTALLEAQVVSSLDGVLVVDGHGKKLLQNQRFTDLLQIPPHIADDEDDEKQVLWVTGMTRDPAAFIVKVAHLYTHPDETSQDEIELKNGTFLDRYSAPVIGGDGTYFGRIWTFRDITERKRAEEKLRLLGAAVEQSKESMMITDTELDLPGPRILFVNPAFTRMTGYTAEEVLGKTPRLFHGPRTDRKVLDRLRRNLAAGEIFDGTTFNYRKDGSEFVLEWQIAPIRQADGALTHYVAIERDITERTRSETLLLESRQRLALATESAGLGVWDWNVVENELVWDARMLTIYGVRSEDFSGAVDAWQNGLHPGDRARAEADLAAALAGPHDFRSEFRVVWPNGEVHEIQAHALVQRAADGSPTRMIGVNWDVTARKRTEARYRRLVESNAQGIFFWTATGGITGTNDAFLSLTGYSREDLEAGRIDWVALTPPEYADIDRRVVAEIAATGTCSPYEKEFTRKDGTRVPILIGAAAFEDDPEAGVCFVLDLTDRKRLETQLVQSQKLETVGKLAGGIAHEFNSILTAIIGQSELLLADLPSGSPLATNATEITKAAGRAAALTRQLLAYGRKQLLQPEALDLNRVVTRMEGMLRHLMGGEIDMRIIATSGLHAVKADAGQLEQAIVQIAINARDAMPNGGKFTMETANVSFDQESVSNYPELKPGDYVMLAITDTGMGMSAEVKARVFEPFFSTKGVGEGTGLGLSTCYGIIKQSGGHISVYSELALGATFKIYLPQVEPSAAVSRRRPAPTDLPRGTETILLVEDDPALREMASALLRRLGYTVLAAANGIEALSLKQQPGIGHVDLLFTDVVMPHMSGKELADRVRALYPHTRILFTSAYTENAIAHQDVLNKGVALLQKPFMPSVLAHKVREVLDQPGDQGTGPPSNAG